MTRNELRLLDLGFNEGDVIRILSDERRRAFLRASRKANHTQIARDAGLSHSRVSQLVQRATYEASYPRLGNSFNKALEYSTADLFTSVSRARRLARALANITIRIELQ